jgi:ABC-type multidrug transport system fused ATPase/permease subunit
MNENIPGGGTTTKVVFAELKRRRMAILLAIFFMLSGSAVTLIQPLFFKMLLDTAIPQKDVAMVAWLLVGMVVTPLAAIGIAYFQEYLRVYIGEHVSQALRKALFDHVIHVKIAEVERITSGEVIYRITRHAGRIGELYIAQELLPVASSAVMFVGTLGFMLALNVKLALIASVALPITYWITRCLARHSKALDQQFSDLLEQGEGFLHEVFQGLRTIRAFNGEDREKSRWSVWIKKHIQLKLKAGAFHQVLLTFPNEVVNYLVIGLLMGYGAYEIMGNRLSVGSLVAFMAYAPRSYAALRSVLNTYVGTQRIKVSVERLDDIFAHPAEPISMPDIQPFPGDTSAPSIEFQNVSFRYSRGFGIEDLSFSVRSGEFLGIVGPTGGGKSTLIDLLLRFYDPESGLIAINGVDIRRISLSSLRANIAVIPQEVFLWNSTVLENMVYPDIVDHMDMKAVEETTRMVQLHDFIQRQPHQYKTVVGERGAALSGGERQRIAIARALRKPSRILVIDEATSALDALTEAKIRETIERIRPGKTTLVIAHRLSTVLHADRILVMDDRGSLVEIGSPQELLSRNGLFSELYRAQALDLLDDSKKS